MANLTRLTLALASIGMIGGCAVGPDTSAGSRAAAAVRQRQQRRRQQQLQPEW